MIAKTFATILITLLLGWSVADGTLATPLCPMPRDAPSTAAPCSLVVDVRGEKGKGLRDMGMDSLRLQQQSAAEPWIITFSTANEDPVATMTVEPQEGRGFFTFSVEMTMMDRSSSGMVEMVAPVDIQAPQDIVETFNTVRDDPEKERLFDLMLAQVIVHYFPTQAFNFAFKDTITEGRVDDLFLETGVQEGDSLCGLACLWDCENPSPHGGNCLEYCAYLCGFVSNRL